MARGLYGRGHGDLPEHCLGEWDVSKARYSGHGHTGLPVSFPVISDSLVFSALLILVFALQYRHGFHHDRVRLIDGVNAPEGRLENFPRLNGLSEGPVGLMEKL